MSKTKTSTSVTYFLTPPRNSIEKVTQQFMLDFRKPKNESFN